MEVKKITICPDVISAIGYDKEGISVSVENDTVYWSDYEEEVHVEGMSKWQAWFEKVTDFANSHMNASDIDMIKWHSQGLHLARELKRKLPDDVEVWYNRPFEDKSGILIRPAKIFKQFCPEMAKLLGLKISENDYYFNEYHKKWDEARWEENYLTRHIKFTAEYLRIQSQRLEEFVRFEENKFKE